MAAAQRSSGRQISQGHWLCEFFALVNSGREIKLESFQSHAEPVINLARLRRMEANRSTPSIGVAGGGFRRVLPVCGERLWEGEHGQHTRL